MGTDAGPDEQVLVELPQDGRAPSVARRATREALNRWRRAQLDNVLLAVSELVTNAVLHGRPTVALMLRRQVGSLIVRVHDGKPAGDMRGTTADDAEHGRGLYMVRAVADR